MLGTIHHPITVDRRLELEHARNLYERISKSRWYGFTKMQTRVARRLSRIITVSENSFKDIVTDFEVDPTKMHIVPVGVDTTLFRPIAGEAVIPGRLITTTSSDVALKGLKYLLERSEDDRTRGKLHH